ncbi:MAG: NAD-dependent epimerase/dehydratase family protein [Acidobacteriota bacterium]
MKILLLGGGGFLSSAVERRLDRGGHHLTVLNRTGRTVCPRTRPAAGDRYRAGILEELAEDGYDGIVDFLCFRPDHARQAVAAFAGRAARHVMISTGSVYWCTGEWCNPVGEDQYARAQVDEKPPTPLTPGSVEFAYGAGKRAAEDLLDAACRRGDLLSVRLRFPVVGGPGDPSGRYAGYLRRVADGGPVVLPDGGFNTFRHLYVEDAAAAVEAALVREGLEGGGYNVASREIVSVRDMIRCLAQLLRRPVPEVVGVPSDCLRRWGMEDLFAPFSCRGSQILDWSRAARELGFAPTPYQDWLAETVRRAPAAANGPGAAGGRRQSREAEAGAVRRYQATLEAA